MTLTKAQALEMLRSDDLLGVGMGPTRLRAAFAKGARVLTCTPIEAESIISS